MADPLLQLRGIRKEFPGVLALDGVDFSVRAGEIHALMGENGAGKSTLIKVLTGVHPADAGSVALGGRPMAPGSPREAEAAGVSTVFQEINLIPTLSVAENITLGRQASRLGFLRWGEIRRRAKAALARLGLDVDPSRQVGSCAMAVQQMVAIARALDIDCRVLVLDEPTSSLDEAEVAELFKAMRRLRDEGIAIVFVTHFLNQVYEITDRITVLRNGALVGEFATAGLPRRDLIGHMLGRDPSAAEALHQRAAEPGADAAPGLRASASARSVPAEAAAVEARGLARKGALRPLDLRVGAGEAVGLAGLLGSGRTEAARLFFGADKADAGELFAGGEPAKIRSPRDAIREGFAFCSEDRKTEGLVPGLSVRENLILAMQARRGIARRLPAARQRELAEHYIKALRIKTPGPETPVGSLSGGNQQKVLLARWLCLSPKLIILDEPTRGIDVGAKAEIEKLARDLCAGGTAILFISSELEEIVRVCGRIAVMRDREKVGELSGAEATEANIMAKIAAHDDAKGGGA